MSIANPFLVRAWCIARQSLSDPLLLISSMISVIMSCMLIDLPFLHRPLALNERKLIFVLCKFHTKSIISLYWNPFQKYLSTSELLLLGLFGEGRKLVIFSSPIHKRIPSLFQREAQPQTSPLPRKTNLKAASLEPPNWQLVS